MQRKIQLFLSYADFSFTCYYICGLHIERMLDDTYLYLKPQRYNIYDVVNTYLHSHECIRNHIQISFNYTTFKCIL